MIILNEKSWVEECLKTGDMDSEKPYKVLQLIAKYYYHCLGYRKKKIINGLTEFMKENYPPYYSSLSSWNDTIEKIAAKAGNYKLYEISEILITKPELEIIDSIENKNIRLVAFTMLCLAKYGNVKNEKNNGWVNLETKEIFKLARVSASTARQDEILGDLGIMGLLEFPKKNGNLSSRVTFVDDSGEIKLRVSDFKELGYEYLLYKGENFIRCCKCGRLTRGNKAGTKKYCNSCIGYIPISTKKIVCVDCGKEFQIDSMNNRSCRCPDCYTQYRKKKIKESVKRYREKS